LSAIDGRGCVEKKGIHGKRAHPTRRKSPRREKGGGKRTPETTLAEESERSIREKWGAPPQRTNVGFRQQKKGSGRIKKKAKEHSR